MKPSDMDLLNRHTMKAESSSKMSLIVKGNSESSSHELRLTDFKTKRRSDSEIGKNYQNTL